MAGRPVNPFILKYFTRVDKKDNQSRRWLYDCKFGDANHGLGIEHRDNTLFNHIASTEKCPNATPEARREAQIALMGKGKIIISESILSAPSNPDMPTSSGLEAPSTQIVASKKRRTIGSMDQFVDRPLSSQEEADANVMFFRFVIYIFNLFGGVVLHLIFRFLVHANVAFRAAENPFLHAWLNKLRPSYQSPSRYVLSHTIMDAEAARAQVEDITRLKSRKRLTLLFDGWEDKLRRSLYGTVAAERGEPPCVLSLDELTGSRGTAEKYLETTKGALKKMDLDDGLNFVALTTDNPTVMQAYRRLMQNVYYWILVSPMVVLFVS